MLPGPPPTIPMLNSESWQTFHASQEGDARPAALAASIDFEQVLFCPCAEDTDGEEDRREAELGVRTVHLYCATAEPLHGPQAMVPEPSLPLGCTDSDLEPHVQCDDDADAAIPPKEEPFTSPFAPLPSSSSPETTEADAHAKPDPETAPSALQRSAPARSRVTGPSTPILPVETPEDDATQASAHDPGANAASTTDATKGDVAPATATPIGAPAPVRTEDQAERSDLSSGEPVIGDPDLDDEARRFVELAKTQPADDTTEAHVRPKRR